MRTSSSPLRRDLTGLGFFLWAVVLAACAGPGTPSPQAILERAAQDALGLKTVRFSLVRQGPSVVLDPVAGTRFSEASGAY